MGGRLFGSLPATGTRIPQNILLREQRRYLEIRYLAILLAALDPSQPQDVAVDVDAQPKQDFMDPMVQAIQLSLTKRIQGNQTPLIRDHTSDLDSNASNFQNHLNRLSDEDLWNIEPTHVVVANDVPMVRADIASLVTLVQQCEIALRALAKLIYGPKELRPTSLGSTEVAILTGASNTLFPINFLPTIREISGAVRSRPGRSNQR